MKISELVGSPIEGFNRMHVEGLLAAVGKCGASSPSGHPPQYLVVTLIRDVNPCEFGQRYHRTGDCGIGVVVSHVEKRGRSHAVSRDPAP